MIVLVAACSQSGGEPGSTTITVDNQPLAVHASSFNVNQRGELVAVVADVDGICASSNGCNPPPDGNYVAVSYAGVAIGDYALGGTASVLVLRYQGGQATPQAGVTGTVSLDSYAAGRSATGHFDVGLQNGTRAHGSFSSGSCATLVEVGRSSSCIVPNDLGH